MAMPLIASESEFEGSGYTTLTEAEAEAWLRSIDLEELIAFTIHSDYVENATPEVTMPEVDVIVTNDEVFVVPSSPLIVEVGTLRWTVGFDDAIYTAPYEPVGGVPGWVFGLSGFLIGAAFVGTTIAVLN